MASHKKRWGIKIVELCVMSNHVHGVASVQPTIFFSKAFNTLKGVSSYELFKRETKFRLRSPKGHLRGKSKFYRTIGDIDLQITVGYVREQKINNFSSICELRNYIVYGAEYVICPNKGFPATSVMGLGLVAVNGPNLVPSPAASLTAFI